MFVEIVGGLVSTASLACIIYYNHIKSMIRVDREHLYKIIYLELDKNTDFLVNLLLEQRSFAKSNIEELVLEEKIDAFEDLETKYSYIKASTQEQTLERLSISTNYLDKKQRQSLYDRFNLNLTLINTNKQRVKLL